MCSNKGVIFCHKRKKEKTYSNARQREINHGEQGDGSHLGALALRLERNHGVYVRDARVGDRVLAGDLVPYL